MRARRYAHRQEWSPCTGRILRCAGSSAVRSLAVDCNENHGASRRRPINARRPSGGLAPFEAHPQCEDRKSSTAIVVVLSQLLAFTRFLSERRLFGLNQNVDPLAGMVSQRRKVCICCKPLVSRSGPSGLVRPMAVSNLRNATAATLVLVCIPSRSECSLPPRPILANSLPDMDLGSVLVQIT